MNLNLTDIIVAIITVIPPTIAILLAWRSSKKAIQEVHLLINSRMTELLSVSKAKSRAEGVIEGENKV